MTLAIYVLLISFGTSLGSFLNVVGLRVPENQSFVLARSACPKCQHQLKWYELVPVISYVFQGGKCRSCQQKISILYPSVELLTGFLVVWCCFHLGMNSQILIAIIYISFLIILSVSIYKTAVIPQNILSFFLVLFILLKYYLLGENWSNSIIILSATVLLVLIYTRLASNNFIIKSIQILIINYLMLSITGLIITILISGLFSCFMARKKDSLNYQNRFILLLTLSNLIFFMLKIR